MRFPNKYYLTRGEIIIDVSHNDFMTERTLNVTDSVRWSLVGSKPKRYVRLYVGQHPVLGFSLRWDWNDKEVERNAQNHLDSWFRWEIHGVIRDFEGYQYQWPGSDFFFGGIWITPSAIREIWETINIISGDEYFVKSEVPALSGGQAIEPDATVQEVRSKLGF